MNHTLQNEMLQEGGSDWSLSDLLPQSWTEGETLGKISKFAGQTLDILGKGAEAVGVFTGQPEIVALGAGASAVGEFLEDAGDKTVKNIKGLAEDERKEEAKVQKAIQNTIDEKERQNQLQIKEQKLEEGKKAAEAKKLEMESAKLRKNQIDEQRRFSQPPPVTLMSAKPTAMTSSYKKQPGDLAQRKMELKKINHSDVQIGPKHSRQEKSATELLHILVPNDKYANALDQAGKAIDILEKKPIYIHSVEKYAKDQIGKKKYTNIVDIIGKPKTHLFSEENIKKQQKKKPIILRIDPENKYGSHIEDKKSRPEFDYRSTVQV